MTEVGDVLALPERGRENQGWSGLSPYFSVFPSRISRPVFPNFLNREARSGDRREVHAEREATDHT
jgi:hypothetical protein